MISIKKWLSTVVTGLLMLVLFGIIFVRLDIVQLTEAFFLELAIVATLVTIVRIFWYNDGEDRAIREDEIKLLKNDYAKLVDKTIKSQDDLDIFVDELNELNRDRWIFMKLKGRTSKNYSKYNSLYSKLEQKSYKKVPIITSSQILTRSANYETINATDYTKRRKIFYQASSLSLSLCMTILLGILAYKELMLNWANVFRYLTYIFNIVWALITSLWNGYKTYKNTTIDHISRLTMIVNRYDEWCKGGKQQCRTLLKSQTTKTL